MTTTLARRRIIASAAGAALLVAGVIVLAGCSDDSGPDAAPATSTTVAASSTTSTTVAPQPQSPEGVAGEFLDAYAAYDADTALSYLTEEGIASWRGYGGMSWGTPELFRSELTQLPIHSVKVIPTGCEAEGESVDGTDVRCTFDYHVYRSDEIGRGPYRGNSGCDFVVRDEKLTSAACTFDIFGSGSSNEMWTPLEAWVIRTHPEDIPIMYPVGDPVIDEEYTRVWEENTRGYADAVEAGTAE